MLSDKRESSFSFSLQGPFSRAEIQKEFLLTCKLAL